MTDAYCNLSVYYQAEFVKDQSVEYTGGKSVENSLKAYYREVKKVCCRMVLNLINNCCVKYLRMQTHFYNQSQGVSSVNSKFLSVEMINYAWSKSARLIEKLLSVPAIT